MFALPSVASAGVWHLEPEDGSTTQTLSFSGGTSRLVTVEPGGDVKSGEIHCDSVSGSGSYENTTTGTLSLLFHSCEDKGTGATCTTSGLSSGTIETTALTFHNVLIQANTPGILITPNSSTNVFAHFVCGFIVPVTIDGNGVIGDVTLSCGQTGVTSGEVDFELENNTQKYKQVTGTGTVYQLTRASNNHIGGQEGTGSVTNSKKSKVNCTA